MKSKLLILSLLLFLGCEEKITQPAVVKNIRLSLYLLNDTSITASAVWVKPLDSLVLASKPFVTQNDISSYVWSTHTFAVQPLLDIFIDQLISSAERPGGVPFVVTVDGESIYLGAFWWGTSPIEPQGAYIDVTLASPYRIQFDSTALQPVDLRGDMRIHDALKEAGILVE